MFCLIGLVNGIVAVQNGAMCELPPEVGPCKGYFPAWYFNILSGSCEQFIYGGCIGNENNFWT